MSACRYCAQPVRWVVTTSGRKMPLDVDPTPTGNVVIMNGMARVLTADQLAQRGMPTERWIPHAATCQNKPRRSKR